MDKPFAFKENLIVKLFLQVKVVKTNLICLSPIYQFIFPIDAKLSHIISYTRINLNYPLIQILTLNFHINVIMGVCQWVGQVGV